MTHGSNLSRKSQNNREFVKFLFIFCTNIKENVWSRPFVRLTVSNGLGQYILRIDCDGFSFA